MNKKVRVHHYYGENSAWQSPLVTMAEAERIKAEMEAGDTIRIARWLKGYEDAGLTPPHREPWTVRILPR